MTTIHTVINQFMGINPLLHSHLQQQGGWDNFHVNHISDLTRFLQRQLRPLGYLAQAEQSLQIRRPDDSSNRTPESDVTIYDPQRRMTETVGLTGGLAIPVPELLELDQTDIASYRAIGIYQKTESDRRGDAVAWLELLSPANKPGGRHANAYRDKRTALLQAGLVFIEVDYLHQQAATVATPSYPQQSGSSPYRIIIIDPRPEWLHGEGRVYSVGIDEKLPTLTIPLNADDRIMFDFDAPYQQTFETLFFGDEVDYAQLPTEWDSYSKSDQARILSRLLAVRANITNLDTPIEIVEQLSFDMAWQRWHNSDKEA